MRASEHKKILREIAGLRGDLLNATALQNGVIDDEQKQLDSGIDYSEQHVRLAIVHTRQDMVLLISAANVAATRLRQIRWMVAVVMICSVVATIRYLGT